jgi:hypothetical protein
VIWSFVYALLQVTTSQVMMQGNIPIVFSFDSTLPHHPYPFAYLHLKSDYLKYTLRSEQSELDISNLVQLNLKLIHA